MRKTILVTGGNGQVGRSMKQALNQHMLFDGRVLDRSKFDLCDSIMMTRVFSEIKPDFVVNAAAYTKVDQAEEDRDGAQIVNVEACRILAKLCQDSDTPLLHYSSDYVYHNGLDRPLRESDPLAPKSIYAVTKELGEQAIQAEADKHFIIRTSWVYDAHGSNFVQTMLTLANKYPELTVVDDQIGSPTYAPDIAAATLSIISAYFEGNLSTADYGIYNFSNEGVCSWFDFAKTIFELSDIDIKVKPVPSSAFPRPAARPPYSVLNKEKIRKLLSGYAIPYWKESLVRCLNEMK
jgi:dTDP-4-dehydrorhamnose reductase